MNFLPELFGIRTCRVHVEVTVLPSDVLPVPGFGWQCRPRTALPPPPFSRARLCQFLPFLCRPPPLGRPFLVENIGFEPMTPSLQS